MHGIHLFFILEKKVKYINISIRNCRFWLLTCSNTFGKAYIVLEGFDYGIFFHVNNDPSTHSISIISWSHYYSFNSNKQNVCPSGSTTHNLKNISHWGLLFFVIVEYN